MRQFESSTGPGPKGETALATFQNTGNEMIDWFYTPAYKRCIHVAVNPTLLVVAE